MAFTYIGVANTYRTIIRNIAALVGDGTSRLVRVGDVGCPLPTGWTEGNGTPDNPPFFDELKKAARKITGAPDDAGLSGLTVPAVFFLTQAPNASFLASLQSLYPDGQLLDEPIIEDAEVTIFGSIPGTPAFTGLIFETNTDGPTYVDLVFLVTAANSNSIIKVKLFHTISR